MLITKTMVKSTKIKMKSVIYCGNYGPNELFQI